MVNVASRGEGRYAFSSSVEDTVGPSHPARAHFTLTPTGRLERENASALAILEAETSLSKDCCDEPCDCNLSRGLQSRFAGPWVPTYPPPASKVESNDGPR